MTSMTGYSYKEKTTEKAEISVEIKSVNSRFLDLKVNLPNFLNQLEKKIRDEVSEKIERGKVEVSIRVHILKAAEKIFADVEVAKSYANAIRDIADAVGLDSEHIPLSLIVNQEGVLTVENKEDIDEYWQLIQPVFKESLEVFLQDRAREGDNLYKDLTEKLNNLNKAAVFFAEWQPKIEVKFREMIMTKFTELLGNAVDEQRIMTETAAMLVKYTINEEVVRLKSHLKEMCVLMKNEKAPGKKIDFLCQEINREINTIGSKNQFAEVGSMVVTAKNDLENIREQAKNIE